MSDNGESSQEAKGLLAKEVSRVLAERGWSLMMAQVVTDVNRGTINNMKQGMGARPELVAKFAKAIAPKGKEAETIGRFLTLAGYPELAWVYQPTTHAELQTSAMDTHGLELSDFDGFEELDLESREDLVEDIMDAINRLRRRQQRRKNAPAKSE